MTVVDLGEKIAKEIDSMIEGNVISAVVYGTDIYIDPKDATDCNMIIVLDMIEISDLEKIYKTTEDMVKYCTRVPLVVEQSEIEGMEDSVPASFLDVLSSYQTVYGKSLFKGLSTINHEHLRAQVEQRIRESLFAAKRCMIKGMKGGKTLDAELERIKSLLRRSLHLYLILKKPWLTEEDDKWSSFIEEFAPDNIWLKQNFDEDPKNMTQDDKVKLSFEITERGIKPLLTRVDELGPE